jgi:hypothetical protein
MTALVPVRCAIPAQAAATAALVRRVEAAARANEDRQEAPRGHQGTAKPAAPARTATPVAALAAQILGARDGALNVLGYGAYERANRLLALESRRVDVTLG